MIKVLHIIPNLVKGGAQRLVLDICIELSKRDDIDLRLVTMYEENAFISESIKVNHHYIPSFIQLSLTGKSIISVDSLQQFIQNFEPAIIHTHLFEAELAARWNIYPGISYFSHFHDNMPLYRNVSFQTFFNKAALTNFIDKRLILHKYKKAKNSFIAISLDTKKYLENVLPSSLHRITLLPNAIDLAKFKRKEKTFFPEMRIITVGRIDKNKNHQFQLDLVQELLKRGKKVSLTIVGDGVERINIQNSINQMQLNDFVSITGNIDCVDEALKQHDIYIHSALSEAFGLTLIEAMACGLPVVTLDGKGNRDLIVEGENGYLLPHANLISFADKIIALAENETLYTSMSNSAYQFAQQFDIAVYVDTLIDLYRNSLQTLK